MVDGGADGTRHKYPRVLLKISGESLMGNQSYGIDTEMVATVAKEVKDVLDSGVEVCLDIGGGNIFRAAHEITVLAGAFANPAAVVAQDGETLFRHPRSQLRHAGMSARPDFIAAADNQQCGRFCAGIETGREHVADTGDLMKAPRHRSSQFAIS